MNRIRIAAIVEGHGETEAIRPLLTRLWTEVIGGDYAEVLTPIRRPRSKLVKKEELQKAVRLAVSKLIYSNPEPLQQMVLVLIDADEDKPCVLAPELLEHAGEVAGAVPVSCVLANTEYESWFVAAASSLAGYLLVPAGETLPQDPEASRSGKRWVEDHFKGAKYSEPVDQPAMTAVMDLHLCRARSRSFDKLCRDLGRMLEQHSD